VSEAPAIEVRGLVKRFGGFTAVDGLDFRVERGEIFGLLGPNGSGKTTTVNMISGLSAPTAGSVAILGVDPLRQAQAARRLLGVVPQETALYEELTAERNLRFHAELFGIPARERAGRIAAMLELAQLTDRARSRVGTFSGGMKRRLAIARALLHQPALVYLDEPTLGVDVQARRVIWDYILQMKSEGRTVLLTTNYLEEGERLCDRMAIIDHGRLVALDTPAALKSRFGSSVLELELEAVPAPALVAAVQALPAVREVVADGERLRVTLAAGAEVPRILGEVARLGGATRHLNLREPSLDEVFLSLTGRGLRD
jgi:ABC-2 type transport system ATP-binding protein